MFSPLIAHPGTIKAVFRAASAAVRALPLYLSRVPAGFPSPADDYLEGELDLNELLIKHPAATFYVRLTGDSMIKAGLSPVSAYGTDLRLCIKEDLGFVVVTKERK
jgi:DNA polymerase V